MKHVLQWQVCLLLSLIACAAQRPAWTTESSSQATACEELKFSSFWPRFVDDVGFQRRHTKSPLQKLVVDATASPGPKPSESSVTLSAQDFPLSPGIAHIKARGLTIKHVQTDRGVQVHFTEPDKDYMVVYFFERDPCWVLVRIEDWSL